MLLSYIMDYLTIKSKLSEHKVSANTQISDLAAFKRIVKSVFGGKIPTKDEIEKSLDKITIGILSIENLGSRKTVLKGFLKVAKLVIGADVKSFEPLTKGVKKTKDKQKIVPLTDDERKNLIEYSKLVELRDTFKTKLKAKFTRDDAKYLILCLFCKLPPMRCQDYRTSLLLDDDHGMTVEELKAVNYIIMSSGRWIINDHKTKGTYQEKVIELDAEIVNLIKEFKAKSKSDYLICTEEREQFEQANMSNWLTRFIGKKISTTALRNIFVSEKMDDADYTEENAENNARIMGHSLETAEQVYSKFSRKHDHRAILKENKELKLEVERLKLELAKYEK